MQYVELGKITDKISRFGLGCMRLPQLADGSGIDDDAAVALIRHAIDSGVNYIDTAYAYKRSEEVVGKALQDGYREKVILVTKIPFDETRSREDMEAVLQKQLTDLQTDYIDVYLAHNINNGSWPHMKASDVFGWFDELKQRGVIKNAGFSFHGDLPLLAEALDAHTWDICMVQYNYLDKFNQAGRAGVEMIAKKGIPVVAMESLHGGMLAQDVPESIVEAFGDFKPKASQAEKAFMWLYNQPEVCVALSGSSSMAQLNDSLRIFDKAQTGILSAEDEAAYDRARKAWESMVNVHCTGCKYCVPCPVGVNIPEIFRMYNETARLKSPQRWLYNAMLVTAEADASKCVQCGGCEPKCPQGIEIMQVLQEAHAELTK